MQVQKLMMLHWRSFWEGSSDIVPIIFGQKASHYIANWLMSLHSHSIIQDVLPKSVDAPLTLMFRR